MDNVYGRFASFFKNYELKEADKYIKRVFPNAEFYLDYEHALVFERIGEDKEIDLDYKKRIKDGCIEFERHNGNVIEWLIEFDLEIKTVYVSWFGNPKDITIAELKAINKQCEELNWL